MDEAIRLACQSVKIGGGPFGAVIVKDNKILGSAHNMVTILNDPTAHAEVLAIRNACQNINSFSLRGCTLYSSCEPCPMCLSAAYWADIASIYYANDRKQAENIGFSDKYIYEELNKPDDEKRILMKQVDPTNANEAFLLWENKIDKVQY